MADWDFKIFVCGARGGMYNSDVTSFFLAAKTKPLDYISLDAGSNMDCLKSYFARHPKGGHLIDPAYRRKVDELGPLGYFRRNQLKGFMVTHAHLDHLAGLIVSSADEIPGAHKPVFGLTSVNTDVKKVFRIPSWPGNFGWYDFIDLAHGAEYDLKDAAAAIGSGTWLNDSPMKVTPFTLDHGGEVSTAYYIEAGTSSVLFFGDTGPDLVAHFDGTMWAGRPREPLKTVWTTVVPKIFSGELKAVFIECSYPNGKPDNLLFGHLSPKYIALQLETILAEWKRKLYVRQRHIDFVLIHVKPTTKLSSLEVPKPAIGVMDTDATKAIIAKILREVNELATTLKTTHYADTSLTWSFHVPNHGDTIYINAADPTFKKDSWGKGLRAPVDVMNAVPFVNVPEVVRPMQPYEHDHDGDFMKYVRYYDDGAPEDGVYHVVMYTEMAVLALLVVLVVCLSGMALGWVWRGGQSVANYIKMAEAEDHDD